MGYLHIWCEEQKKKGLVPELIHQISIEARHLFCGNDTATPFLCQAPVSSVSSMQCSLSARKRRDKSHEG